MLPGSVHDWEVLHLDDSPGVHLLPEGLVEVESVGGVGARDGPVTVTVAVQTLRLPRSGDFGPDLEIINLKTE